MEKKFVKNQSNHQTSVFIHDAIITKFIANMQFYQKKMDLAAKLFKEQKIFFLH